MRITFEQEGNCYFAISQDAVHDGYRYDEIIWAEITDEGSRAILQWEDSYNTKQEFKSYPEAAAFVKKEWYKHKPTPNGNKYFLG